MSLRAAALLLALAIPASAAAAPTVDVMVVGRTATLAAPKTVPAKPARVKVGGKRCRIGATPLAALVRTRLPLRLRDYGSCGRRAADAGAVYVRAVRREAERGAGGWVYKVGNRTPTVGAADPSARLRRGDQVLWFWCRTGGNCQRTLEVTPTQRTVSPGAALDVRVLAYDDQGEAEPAVGATVRMGSATATAGTNGIARLTVPDAPGRLDVVATQPKLVRSFPATVRVG